MTTCSVPDCTTEATAKGMCAKHRMRQLRGGAAEVVRRPGRPDDELRDQVRVQMADAMSPGTFARYWRAFTILGELGLPGDRLAAIRRCTRPNGGFNVAAFNREADRAVIAYVDRSEGWSGSGAGAWS